jgi:hypothetical protein
MRVPRAQTIVRQIAGPAGTERFCVLHEAPLAAANAFMFSCAGGACAPQGVSMGQVCDLLVAAGVSEPDIYLLIEEARSGYRPTS